MCQNLFGHPNFETSVCRKLESLPSGILLLFIVRLAGVESKSFPFVDIVRVLKILIYLCLKPEHLVRSAMIATFTFEVLNNFSGTVGMQILVTVKRIVRKPVRPPEVSNEASKFTLKLLYKTLLKLFNYITKCIFKYYSLVLSTLVYTEDTYRFADIVGNHDFR